MKYIVLLFPLVQTVLAHRGSDQKEEAKKDPQVYRCPISFPGAVVAPVYSQPLSVSFAGTACFDLSTDQCSGLFIGNINGATVRFASEECEVQDGVVRLITTNDGGIPQSITTVSAAVVPQVAPASFIATTLGPLVASLETTCKIEYDEDAFCPVLPPLESRDPTCVGTTLQVMECFAETEWDALSAWEQSLFSSLGWTKDTWNLRYPKDCAMWPRARCTSFTLLDNPQKEALIALGVINTESSESIIDSSNERDRFIYKTCNKPTCEPSLPASRSKDYRRYPKHRDYNRNRHSGRHHVREYENGDQDDYRREYEDHRDDRHQDFLPESPDDGPYFDV